MEFYRDHILTIILFTPLLGVVALFLVPPGNKNAIRWVGNIATFVGFLISLPLVFWFPSETPDELFKFIERALRT